MAAEAQRQNVERKRIKEEAERLDKEKEKIEKDKYTNQELLQKQIIQNKEIDYQKQIDR
jgi:hypothetical protein